MQRSVACRRPCGGGLQHARHRPAVLHPQRVARPAPAVQRRREPVTTALETQEETPYFDAMCRSFLLGVSAGAVVEAVHMLSKLGDVAGLLSSQPLFLWDHVAAVLFWLLLYAAEASVILSVYRRYEDEGQAVRALRGMATLSKRMLPLRLNVFKRAVHALATGHVAALTAAPELAAPTGSDAPAQPLAFIDAPVADVVADIRQRASAPTLPRPLGLPELPQPPAPPADDAPAPRARRGDGLARRRREAGLAPGAWDPAARGALVDKRSRELVERKSYLKNFWYAAALSESLKPGKPLGVDILGSRVVLFRDGDRVLCLDDACPHRAAPLSDGWLTQSGGHTCVTCPYHGWAVDGEGRLRDVPSAEPGRWPKRPLVGSYPVEERGGFIWLFWGDAALPADERPPIPWTPELEDPSWHAVYGEIEFECGHWGVFENAIDMAHIHYLHNDSFGNADKPRIADMATTRDTFHVEATFSIHNKPVSKLWEWTAVESVPVTAKAMLPSSSAITIQLGHGVSMITFVNTVPISENRSINRFALVRNFAGWEGFDAWARSAMFRILGEDKVMVEKLTPERLAQEFSLGPDAPQTAFRKLRQEWVNCGYAVPPESVKPRRGLAPDL